MNLNYLFLMWYPFISIRRWIICLNLPTELGNLNPFTHKRCLQNINTWMRNITDHLFQQRPHRKSMGLNQVWGSHISLLQNLGKWHWHQSWVFLVVWDGAPFCWKVKGWSLKCFFISSNTKTKISLM